MIREAVAALGLEVGLFLFTSEPSHNLPKVRSFIAYELENERRFFDSILKEGLQVGEVGALFAAVCWALSAISVQKGVKKISPSEGTLISTIVNVLFFVPLLILQIIFGREQLPVLTNVEILKGMTLLTLAGFFVNGNLKLYHLSGLR